MTPDRYRLAGWLASGLCLAVAAGLIVSRHAALVAATAEERRLDADLRRRAHLCGVSISRWSSRATDYANKDGSADPDKRAMEGVTKVTCDLALTGPYANLRAFLADVWASDRLLNVAHVDWARTDAGSELSFSLGRYLEPITTAPKDVPKP